MGLPEDIPNIEPFPLAPRVRKQEQGGETAPAPKKPERPLSPVNRAKVEFWHQGEKPLPREELRVPKKHYDYARRADQLTIFMAAIAGVVLVLVLIAVKWNDKKYSVHGEMAKKTASPNLDFYQGNRTFSKVVNIEKNRPVDSANPELSVVEDAMVIPLKDQMSSMQEKLEKIRSQRLVVEEPAEPEKDTGVRPEPLKPMDEKNFSAPMEFNGMLPKQLREQAP